MINKKFGEELIARGLWKQLTHEQETKDYFSSGQPFTVYIGFDPTADSLHVGSMLGLITLKRFQDAGHKAIVLCGGATGLVGDPSGKSELRQVLTPDIVNANIESFKPQMAHFLDFKSGKSQLVNNADWFSPLTYLDFVREVGGYFTINRMLQAECIKGRMDRGLTLTEFNYMIMQAYDYLVLHQKYGCNLQSGGDDQWSNIISGVDLIRKKLSQPVFGLTYPLLLTTDGKKMGKTESGAIWLDANKTLPYDFFQYWRNVEDANVINLMKLITFMNLDEIAEYEKFTGKDINSAKERLALEITTLLHGEEEAKRALAGAKKLFGADGGADDSAMPTTTIDSILLDKGIGILDLLVTCGITQSKGEGRKLIESGAIAVNGEKVSDQLHQLKTCDLNENKAIIIRKGKKVFHKVVGSV